jgi:quercetin dioxygenase-like cupin family protein
VTACAWLALAGALGGLAFAGAASAAPAIEEKLALDNECVRISLLTLPAGAVSGIHLNPEPEVGIVVEGTLTLVTSKGKEPFTPGEVIYLKTGTVHDALNETPTPVKVWALNLKKCP